MFSAFRTRRRRLKFSFGNSGHSFYAGSQGFSLIKSQSRSNSIFKIHLNSICFVKVQILAHVSVILIPCSFPFSTGEKFLEWEISELEIFVDTFLATRFWWHFPLLEEPRVFYVGMCSLRSNSKASLVLPTTQRLQFRTDQSIYFWY